MQRWWHNICGPSPVQMTFPSDICFFREVEKILLLRRIGLQEAVWQLELRFCLPIP